MEPPVSGDCPFPLLRELHDWLFSPWRDRNIHHCYEFEIVNDHGQAALGVEHRDEYELTQPAANGDDYVEETPA